MFVVHELGKPLLQTTTTTTSATATAYLIWLSVTFWVKTLHEAELEFHVMMRLNVRQQ
jgi:hypothetical protein